MSTKQEYIAEADRLLVQAGVPTYSEVLKALTDARDSFSSMAKDTSSSGIEMQNKAATAYIQARDSMNKEGAT